MRRILPLALSALALCPLLPAQLAGQDQNTKLLPYQKAFSNLSAEKRRTFIKHHKEAQRLFGEKRIIEALEVLKFAEREFADSPEMLNVRGSCYVELRAFDKALVCFNRAAELSEGNYSVLFNIGEVHFVTQQWEKSHEAFESLLKRLPEDRVGIARISEFKLMLCKIKLGKKEEAMALANKYDFLDDSPFHYFAKAVLAYEEEDLAEAGIWMARASRIFRNPAALAPWHDTMVEYGYIESFYGNDDQ